MLRVRRVYRRLRGFIGDYTFIGAYTVYRSSEDAFLAGRFIEPAKEIYVYPFFVATQVLGRSVLPRVNWLWSSWLWVANPSSEGVRRHQEIRREPGDGQD